MKLPDGAREYRRTAVFDEHTVPRALLADHSTKPGVWGLIHVLAGSLTYIVEPPYASEQRVGTGETAVVVPERKHRVRPEGAVQFFVAFYR